jgi:glucosamine-6-phosphate deaminase
MALVRPSTKRPRVYVFDDYSKLSQTVALKIASVIHANRGNKKTVLGLATGSSPLGVYRELIKMYRQRTIDFSDCVFFNLDEYSGISQNDLQSYHRFMVENFFEHVDVQEDQINIPDGLIVEKGEDAVRSYCREYEAKIKALGGIDLQLLGMGRNGHIGFNEPGSPIDSRTRLVTLSETTRKDAAPDFFGMTNVPTRAITMGVGTILDSKQVVLLVSGEHKASTFRNALEGAPTPKVPASFLQYHDSVEAISDRAAASLLIEYTSPWLVRNIDWKREESTARRAMLWLAERKNKTLDKLSAEDFNAEHLASLRSIYGQGFGSDLLKEFETKINALKDIIPETPARVLILSPHPDDDVICVGATMQKLVANGNDVYVAYMVSGSNAVKDADVLNYLALGNKAISEMVLDYGSAHSLEYDSAVRSIVNSIYSKAKGSPDDPFVRKIKGEIRRQEAVRASSRAGANAQFLDLPFYEEYGSARKAPISELDVEIVKRFLLKLKPEAIFAAGDTTDPNGTHSMCMDAFQTASSSLKDFAENTEEKAYASNFSLIPIIQYRGAWQEYTLDEADVIEVFDKAALDAKIEMILEHVSQLDPLFPGPYDDRQFWERARDRNLSFVQCCKKTGMKVSGIGAEVYKRLRGSE